MYEQCSVFRVKYQKFMSRDCYTVSRENGQAQKPVCVVQEKSEKPCRHKNAEQGSTKGERKSEYFYKKKKNTRV